MKLFVLYDPGDGHSNGDDEYDDSFITVYQTEAKLYKDILDEMEDFDIDPEKLIEANLYYDKGDYDGILDVYADVTDVRLSVFPKELIK